MTAAFLTKLNMEQEDSKTAGGSGEWELKAVLKYHSDLVGDVEVPIGYRTDLGSVPRLPFAYAWFGNIAQAASVVHDFLYTTKQYSRAVADAVLREAMQATGFNWVQRNAWWAGVRLFGWLHW